MSDLGSTRLVQVAGREVICRELSVAGVRQLIASAGTGDLVSEALFPELRLSDLPALTNLTPEDIDAMRPSDLAKVLQGCKEANPDFFAMLARLRKPQQPA